MFERVIAAVVLAACAALLVRMLLGFRQRQRLDARIGQLWRGLRRWAQGGWRGVARPARAVLTRRASRRAAKEAIERARGRGDWDGNVYTPKSFRKPPRDTLH
jgi:hypothetical protein